MGKRKLTESAREFPKAAARPSPKGSFRKAVKRTAGWLRIAQHNLTSDE